MTEQRKTGIDRNIGVSTGIKVTGYVCRLLKTAVLVTFTAAGKKNRCGILHESEFKGLSRKERRQRFRKSYLGQRLRGLHVIEVSVPSGKRKYTSVRLSLRPVIVPVVCPYPLDNAAA